MEDIIPIIFQGCKLARELESKLDKLANQPDILWNKCNEMISIFSNTRDRINHLHGVDQEENIGGAMQQAGPRCSPPPPMDLITDHLQISERRRYSGFEGGVIAPNLDGRDMERRRGSGSKEVVLLPVGSGRGSSLSQRIRRKDEAESRIVTVAAPRMVNTEIPPEDGYTWRKYGQKDISGSKFPRGYYRCTHQKLYQCPAKKQVQRLDHDPFTFEVIYRAYHTCTMSSTAPSISRPSTNKEIAPNITQQAAVAATSSSQLQSLSTSAPVSDWLSMDIGPPTGELAGLNSSSAGAGPDPSTVRFGSDHDQYYHPVVEYSDVMFNTGSSSNSNMDLIFSADMVHKDAQELFNRIQYSLCPTKTSLA